MPFKFNSVLSDSPDYFPFLFKVHLTRKSVPHFTYKLLCLSLTTRWTAGLADSMSTQRQNHYQFFLSIISFKWALMCSDWLKPATPVWKMMRKKPHSGKWVSFPRFLQLSGIQIYSLYGISDLVPANSDWQCHYYDNYRYWSSPSYSHVLLS